MAEFDPEAWAHEQAAGFDPERWADSLVGASKGPKREYFPPSYPDTPTTREVSTPEVLARAGAKGATLGGSDELAGGIGAMGHSIAENIGYIDPITGEHHQSPKSGRTFDEMYRQDRDAYRVADTEAEETSPALFNTVDALSGIPTAVVAGGPVKSGLGAFFSGMGLGGVSGALNSESDLTKGEVGGVALDSGVGAAAGGLFGLLGYGASKLPAENLGRLLRGRPIPANVGEAAAALGFPRGSPPNAGAQEVLSANLESYPPSALGPLSNEAPEVLARVGRSPGVQVTENLGKQAVREAKNALLEGPKSEAQGAKSKQEILALAGRIANRQTPKPSSLELSPRVAEEVGKDPLTISAANEASKNLYRQAKDVIIPRASLPKTNEKFQLLERLQTNKMPTGGITSDVLQGAKTFGGPVASLVREAISGGTANAERTLRNPETVKELLQLMAAGSEPGLAPDAAHALASRAGALLGVDITNLIMQ